MRVGIGFDSHRLVEGRPLILGGVEIPHGYGLAGWSDADVLLHAIIDAMLGAAGIGDIGEHFPDTDRAYRGASSIDLIIATRAIIESGGFRVVNVDSVIILEEPKIKDYRDSIKKKISSVLGVPINAIGVKAKTSEGMGFIGRKEGIVAHAVVLLEER